MSFQDCLLAAMQGANLVAIWGTQIRGRAETAHPARHPPTHLDAFAPAGDPGIVKGLNFLGTVAREPDGATIGESGGFAVDGLADAKSSGRRAIEYASLRIDFALGDTDGAKSGIIEFLGNAHVVCANKYV